MAGPASDKTRDMFFSIDDIVQGIMYCLDPVDVAALSQTCRALHAHVDPATNATLYCRLFHNLFDDLNTCRRGGYEWNTEKVFTHPEQDILKGSTRTCFDMQSEVPDYARLVKSRIRARGIVNSPHASIKAANRAAVTSVLLDILLTSSNLSNDARDSNNVTFLRRLLSSKANIADWLDPRILLDPPGGQSSCLPLSKSAAKCCAQQAARLRLAALNRAHIRKLKYSDGLAHRSEIYRIANFSDDNLWGPFMQTKTSNGKTTLLPDYKMLDNISMVMSLNIESAWRQWGTEDEMRMLPYGFEHAVFWKQPGPGRDWAAVEGEWSYIYAFLDYSDFFAYNHMDRRNNLLAMQNIVTDALEEFLPAGETVDTESSTVNSEAGPSDQASPLASPEAHQDLSDEEEDSDFVPNGEESTSEDDEEDDAEVLRRLNRGGALQSLADVAEAVGGVNSMRLSLVDETEEEEEAHQGMAYPPLRFKGQSTGPHGSTFTGKVEMLEDGSRYWNFIVRYGGEDRWSTAGVEVGGRGVYGIWSDVNREELSPVGPVWYYRSG